LTSNFGGVILRINIRSAPITPEVHVAYQFGPYLLDSAKRVLTKDGKSLALAPKTFDLLLLFIESQGRVLTRSALISALWPDTFVEEANLSFQISALRKALGSGGMEWIETVPKYGYRFTGPITEVGRVAIAEVPATDERRPTADEAKAESRAPIESEPVDLPPSAGPFAGRALFWPILAGLTTLAAIILAVVHFRAESPKERTVRFLISPPDAVKYVSSNISPDGKWLALVALGPDGGRQLFVRSLRSLKAEPLAGTELVDSTFWSPDSRFIGFFANGKLKTTSLSGPPKVICDAPGGGAAGSWSAQGQILFQTRAHPQLYRVAAQEGVAVPATLLNTAHQETAHYAPQFLPDGRHFIYFVRSLKAEHTGLYVGSLDSKESKRLLNSNGNSIYAQSPGGKGYLLFTSGTTLMGQVFDPAKLQLVGEPFQVVQQVQITLASGLNRGNFSASQNGVLVYRTAADTPSSELVWFDRRGKRLSTVGEPANYSNPALSPDEKKLAVSREDPQTETRDLWLFNLEHGTSSRLTFDPTDETCPSWAPDSARLAYCASNKGAFDIYQKVITNISKPELLLESNENKVVQGWSSDGQFIVFTTTGGGTWTLSLDGARHLRARLGEGRLQVSSNVEISPDGRWIAYQFDGPIRSEVYVERLGPPGGEWQVSTSGGIEPHWRRDGKELYFISENKLMAVGVKTDSKVFEAVRPAPLFELRLDTVSRRSRYQVAANGQKFLINSRLESPSPVTVVLNWTGDLQL
jgi:Tol biopolymer transport system component/DNA-binding winged helix-turn-helix (wHTH) protein